jgi:hypothetical protein
VDALLEALKNPGSMTSTQWLLLGIILFFVVGIGFVTFRLYRSIEAERRSRYVPNIGRKRLEAERQRKDV